MWGGLPPHPTPPPLLAFLDDGRVDPHSASMPCNVPPAGSAIVPTTQPVYVPNPPPASRGAAGCAQVPPCPQPSHCPCEWLPLLLTSYASSTSRLMVKKGFGRSSTATRAPHHNVSKSYQRKFAKTWVKSFSMPGQKVQECHMPPAVLCVKLLLLTPPWHAARRRRGRMSLQGG